MKIHPLFLFAIALIIIVALLGGSASNDLQRSQSQRANSAATLTWSSVLGSVSPAPASLPPYPFWPNEALRIDENLITTMANSYCQLPNENPSSPDFYLGYLPLESFDSLITSNSGIAPASLLGNLYISGYFGGIWLRDSMASSTDSATGSPAQEWLSQNKKQRLTFAVLLRAISNKMAILARDHDSSIILKSRETLPQFLSIYGYNLGYVQTILANPPQGLTIPENMLQCEQFLDCSSGQVSLDLLSIFPNTVAKLHQPPNWRWQHLAELAKKYGEGSIESGAAVWEDILADSTIAPEAYLLLLDLSVNFLLVSQVTILANMEAWGENSVDAARDGILLETGLETWSWSYFMGLASNAPAGTFPELGCLP